MSHTRPSNNTPNKTTMSKTSIKRSAFSFSCEPLDSSPHEVYFQGSEEEDYPEVRRQKRRQREAIGRQYLQGRPPVMLSTGLRGPFQYQWPNPWGTISSAGNFDTDDIAEQHEVIGDPVKNRVVDRFQAMSKALEWGLAKQHEMNFDATKRLAEQHKIIEDSSKRLAEQHKMFEESAKRRPAEQPRSIEDFMKRRRAEPIGRPSMSERVEATRKASQEACQNKTAKEIIASITPSTFDEAAYRERSKAGVERLVANAEHRSAKEELEEINSASPGSLSSSLRLEAAKREAIAKVMAEAAEQKYTSFSSSAGSSQRSGSDFPEPSKESAEKLKARYAKEQRKWIEIRNKARADRRAAAKELLMLQSVTKDHTSVLDKNLQAKKKQATAQADYEYAQGHCERLDRAKLALERNAAKPPTVASPLVAPEQTSSDEDFWCTRREVSTKAVRRLSFTASGNVKKRRGWKSAYKKASSPWLHTSPSTEKGGQQDFGSMTDDPVLPLKRRTIGADFSRESEALPEAQLVSGGPGMTGIGPSGPSTNLLETDKLSMNERDSYADLSTQAALFKAQQSFRRDVSPPPKSPPPRYVAQGWFADPINYRSPSPETTVKFEKMVIPTAQPPYQTYPMANEQEPMSTQAMVDALSPFAITTIKKEKHTNFMPSPNAMYERCLTSPTSIYQRDPTLPTPIYGRGSTSPTSIYERGPTSPTSIYERGPTSPTLSYSPSPAPSDLRPPWLGTSPAPSDLRPPWLGSSPGPSNLRPPWRGSSPERSLASFSIAPNGTLSEVYQPDGQQRSAQYSEVKWDLDAAIEDAGTFLGSWDVEAEARKEGEAGRARMSGGERRVGKSFSASL